MKKTFYESPIGKIILAGEEDSLCGLWFENQKYIPDWVCICPKISEDAVFQQVRAWLDSYFSGNIPDVLPKLKPCGSAFQKEVWEILMKIPYGQTVTYGEIARELAGRRNIPHFSSQAVGGAVGHNPISILIPCHRVLGAHGQLTGYAGGLQRKEYLLKLENATFSLS